LVTAKGEYLSKMGTQEIEALLPPQLLRRIHRSFIVSVGKIDAYSADAVELGGVTIPVGRGYRDVLEGL
jgi:two-component system, LytTR family, response regulator